MRKKASSLSREESKLLTRVMTMGRGRSLPVVMSPGELARLIGVIYHDNAMGSELEKEHPGLWPRINPDIDYYQLPEQWFLDEFALEPEQHVALMRTGENQIEDFSTYLHCLSELHKRRRKYAMILAAQPMPTMVQVSPRSLVEFGTTDPQALASWLTWRKFFYDLDNRSAQETGYLFEPILAEAIGGVQKSDKTLVVTRTGDSMKGRQVDCWKILPDGQKLAYEFKLRVTDAASRQGRFQEEIQFAEDAQNSGAVPILMVLDPTPNPTLSGLKSAYKARGGRAYLGDEAWEHLEDEAGKTMARFIENYVRKPVSIISRFEHRDEETPARKRIDLLDLQASYTGSELILHLGTHERRIVRVEDLVLGDDGNEENQSEDDT